jgi:hypothetical protein
MNVEDSYEGAVRRLRRLGHAAVEAAPPRVTSRAGDETATRMRDLEDLASMACDENEQLTRELDRARDEISRLRQLVATLQETLMTSQVEQSVARQKSGRSGAFYFVMFVLIGGAGAGLFALHPWERAPSYAAVGASTTSTTPSPTPSIEPTPAAAPTPAVTAAPAPAPIVPKVEATIPKAAPVIPTVAPTIPKVASTIPKVAPVAAAPAHAKSHHQHAKHHAAKPAKHHAASSHSELGTESSKTDDPLGGLGPNF